MKQIHVESFSANFVKRIASFTPGWRCCSYSVRYSDKAVKGVIGDIRLRLVSRQQAPLKPCLFSLPLSPILTVVHPRLALSIIAPDNIALHTARQLVDS